MLLADRSEADATITEEDRRYAMPRRRCQYRVPGCLAVIVGVDIDPAGGDEQTVRLDLAFGCALPPTAVSLPPSIAMSPVKALAPVPSRIVPPRITMSCMVFAPKCPCCAEGSMRPDRASAIGGATRRARVAMPPRKSKIDPTPRTR